MAGTRVKIHILLAFCGLLLAHSAPGAETGWSTDRVWTTSGELEYRLYLPVSANTEGKGPLIVALHGCKQTAEELDRVARLTELAERVGATLLLPVQSRLRNPDGCWNWFWAYNQTRFTGEPAMIAAAVESVLRKHPLDRTQTLILGLSAGGAMANLVASCYPDLFSAVAVHSGVQFAAATSPAAALRTIERGSTLESDRSGDWAYECGRAFGRPVPGISFHGDQDRRVSPINADQLFSQWARMADRADPGSVKRSPSREVAHPTGLSYSVQELTSGSEWVSRRILVHGLAHAWSGGAPDAPHGDPRGPDATAMIWEFFQQAIGARNACLGALAPPENGL